MRGQGYRVLRGSGKLARQAGERWVIEVSADDAEAQQRATPISIVKGINQGKGMALFSLLDVKSCG